MTDAVTFVGGRIFDGARLVTGRAARFEGEVFAGFVDPSQGRTGIIELNDDILSPGFVDLQVNGGGGVMLNDVPSVETVSRIAAAHRGLGTVRLLPTLITDTPEATTRAIDAVADAIASRVPGVAGLHLEGPHIARAGAHDPGLTRAMTDGDLKALLTAKARLPVLKVTVAPKRVTRAQVAALAEAGVVVSLGHTDADYRTCLDYAAAGARAATHLFNAMSPLRHREPGLVGAALDCGALSAGVIADGIHVDPAAMRIAWRAKAGPGKLYLVSDAMAVAGTDLDQFSLNGRRIRRSEGRLTLEDGTLAGADLNLTHAIRLLVEDIDVTLEGALRAAITTPAEVAGLPVALKVGETRLSDMIRLSADLSRAEVLG
ncbi:MAG: N-acetylglucosamine-6-phosphate deacetylase [Pseudomonadota bacterium]